MLAGTDMPFLNTNDPGFNTGDPRFMPGVRDFLGTAWGRNADGTEQDTMSSRNPQWARWFDALKAMNGGKVPTLTGAPGLPTDDHYGTLPLSLQNLPGAAYVDDDFGAPVGVRMKRK